VKSSSVQDLINNLKLVRHPEGGWYRETYRSAERISGSALPGRYGGERSLATAIYFLLERGDISAFHRIKSDEVWYFHDGDTLTIQVLTPSGEHQEIRLGARLQDGDTYQAVIPAGCWFGAEVAANGLYSLVSCSVAPGFDFADFEMGEARALCRQFPASRELIKRLTS
jgi:predicted cupin superfamily sugar epimerase